MSYDLMAFKEDVAPESKDDFMKWFGDQTNWKHDYDYTNPDNSSGELRAWFSEMIKTFPPMNGPLASDGVDDHNISDYSIAPDSIYVTFAWSVAEKAKTTAVALSKKHGVGIFDASSSNRDIYSSKTTDLTA
jgi:hypothetical protein